MCKLENLMALLGFILIISISGIIAFVIWLCWENIDFMATWIATFGIAMFIAFIKSCELG